MCGPVTSPSDTVSAVIESASGILAYVTTPDRRIHVNRRFARWAGLQRTISGCTLEDFFARAGCPWLHGLVHDALRGHACRQEFAEATNFLRYRHVVARAVPNVDERGVVRGVLLHIAHPGCRDARYRHTTVVLPRDAAR